MTRAEQLDRRPRWAEQTAGQGLIQERWGTVNPLSQTELGALRDEVNSEFITSGIDKEQRWADTIRAVEFVTASEYTNPVCRAGYATYEAYLEAHYAAINTMLAPAGLHAEVARLVVIQDTVVAPASWHTGWVADGFADADGADGVWHTGISNPQASSYWDPARRIDIGAIHEWCHRVLHLPDLYAADVYLQGGMSKAARALFEFELARMPVDQVEKAFGMRLEQAKAMLRAMDDNADAHTAKPQAAPEEASVTSLIRPDWLSYRDDQRWKPSIMNGGMVTELGPVLTEMVKRRMDGHWLHNGTRAIPEGGWDYPNEGPREIALALGNDWAGATVELRRITADPTSPQTKYVVEQPIVVTQAAQQDAPNPGFPALKKLLAGDAPMANPFTTVNGESQTHSQDAVMLVVARKDGKMGWQYVWWSELLAARGLPAARIITNLANNNSPSPDQFVESTGVTGPMMTSAFLPIVAA